MRIKLGPYKVTPEFWQRMQQLPGENDEQRVMLALDFACDYFEAETRRRAEYQMRGIEAAAQKQKAEQFASALADQSAPAVVEAMADALIDGGPVVVRINEDGTARAATPEERAMAMAEQETA